MRLNSGDRALRQAARCWGCECCARDDDPDAEMRMVCGPGGRETPTRYSTAFGKWGVGTARIDGVIAVGSEEGRWWAVVEEVFPEQDGARGTTVPLSDHLLIELRRSVRSQASRGAVEQRPVAVRLDSSAVSRETAAAYAAIATGSGFAEQLRLDPGPPRLRHAGRRALPQLRARCVHWASR